MRFTFISCLLAAVFANEYVPQWGHLAEEENLEGSTMKNAIKVTEGLIRGAISAEMPKLDKCISDGGAIVHDVEIASKKLKSHKTSDVKKGLKALGDAFFKAKDALIKCRGAYNEIRKLEQMAITFSSPETALIHIGKDIIIHGVSIIREVNAAVHAYEKNDFYHFGYNVGKAGAQILIGEVAPVHDAASDTISAIEGFLVGAIGGEFPDLDQCITDGTDIVQDIEDAVALFEKKDVDDVINGLLKIGDVLMKIYDGVKDCESIGEDITKIEKMAAAFSSPEAFAVHIGTDILVHGVDIFSEITAAVTDMTSDPKNYYDFGLNIGKASAQILLGQVEPLNEVELEATMKQAVKVTEGLLRGAISGSFPKLDKCIKDGGAIVNDVKKASTNLKSKNVRNVRMGLKYVGHAIYKARDALKNCKGSVGEVQRLSKMAATFSTPETAIIHIGQDIIIHGVSIINEINAAVNAYKKNDYYAFGYNVGEAAAQIIIGEEAPVQNKDTVKDVLEVIGGVVKGAIDAEFSDLDKCIQDGEAIIEDAVSAVNHFKKKDINDVIAGLKDIGDILTKVEDALKSCQAVEKDFKKLTEMAAYFSSPQGAIIHIGKDIIVHGVDIFKEVTGAVRAFEDKKYYDFGYNVGKAAAHILLGEEQQEVESTVDDVIKVIEGVLKGAIDVEFSDLDQCIQDGEDIIKDVESAANHFKSKNINDIIAGLKDIGDVLTKVEDALQACQSIEGDFKKLAEMAAYFSSPEGAIIHIGKDIVVHGVDIFKEVTAAVKAYDDKKWYDFGYNVGKAGAQILLGEEQQKVESTLEEVLEVVGGVLKGAIDADFSDLDQCIEDGTGIVEDVESAVNHFKSKNVKDIIAGLKDVGDILTKVEDALTTCQAIEGDFKKLKEMAAYFSSPQGALIHIGKDIIVHGTDIYKEVTAAVKAMEDKQYYNFGYNVGKAGAQILLGEQKLEATAHDIVKVIEGVIKGAVDVEFSDLDQCIQDGVDIIDDVWDAVEKFQSKNPDEVVKGIKDIGLILEKAGAAITDCKDIKEADLSKLTELATYFSDPQTAIVHIGKDIVIHGVDIIKEVTAAVKAMEQKDYYDFGLNIGKAAAQILIGAEVEATSGEDAVKVVEGLIWGALEAEFKVAQCVDDIVKIELDIEEAVKNFESKNAKGIKNGLLWIKKAFSGVYKALKDCDDFEEDIEKLEELGEAFSNPIAFVIHVAKDIIVHGVQIIKEIEGAVHAWRSSPRNYYSFGENIGKAAAQVLLGHRYVEEIFIYEAPQSVEVFVIEEPLDILQ